MDLIDLFEDILRNDDYVSVRLDSKIDIKDYVVFEGDMLRGYDDRAY